MPSLPKFLTRSSENKSKTAIARYGSTRPIDRETLAQVYEDGQYSDPATGFGPGTPPIAMPMDSSGQPRRQQGQVGHNYISQPGQGRIDYALCQALVDNYDLFRQAIYIRIDEIACMDWDIVPDPLVIRSVKDKRDINAANQGNIQAARAFFKKPDRMNTFQIWIRNLLEDHFVFDAMTIYKRRTYGGRLYSLEYIDGGLIKPLMNTQFRKPEPPEVAFQQYIYGKPVFDFTADELIYAPKNVRPRSVYGFSIVEQFMLHINLALRFQAWNTAFFTDGNIPSRLLTAPDNWTADKIEEWQQIFDALIAGDPAAQRKLFMVPPGVQEIGGGNEGMFNYALEFSNYLIDITCVATGVTRQELGLEPANSEGLGGSGLHDAMESVHNRRLVRLANFLADVIFTPILQEEFGLQNFVWSWPALEAQDPRAHAELNQILLFSAQKSLDEILMEQGQEPVGIGRFLNLGGKLLFEKDMLNMQSEGTLALEQQQAKQQLDDQTEQTKEIAEHQTEQTKEIAEHAAGLQQNQAEQQAQLGQQAAEQGAGLQSQQNEQQAQLQQANAEQQVQVQGDMDMQQADHQAQLTQQQLVQQQQFQAQQSRLQHQYTMTQQQQAAEYAHHQALTNYHLRMGLPPPATPVADPNGAGAMPQPATPDANPATKFLLERAQAADFDRQNQQLQNDMALATIPEMEPGNPDESPDWDMDGAQQDVSQWGRKLEKAAKAGKDLARVKFVPNFLTSEQTDLIQGTINKMATPTPTEIRQTFRHIQEVFSSGTDDQEPG